MVKNRNSSHFLLFIFIIMSICLIAVYQQRLNEVSVISYSELLQNAKDGKIKEVTWGYPETQGILKPAAKDTAESGTGAQGKESGAADKGAKFKVYVPNPEDLKLFDEFEKHGVKVTAEAPKTGYWMLLINLLPIALGIMIVFFIFRQLHSGSNQAMSFGRSRAKLLTEERKKVTFSDVAGVDEAKEELKEVVDFLQNPDKYRAMGARIPKGILLLGAPGTGKTLLGRAVAGEAGVPFFFMSGSDFVEMFVGVGASRVRDLFEQAKKSAPCIVFIDEIDAVGRQRGAGYGGGHDEREQTLNQLLVEMDGFEPNNGVIILAATNRHDVLDPALLRPGRFDRHIVVDRPDVAGRKAILKIHVKDKPIDKGVDLEILAKRTPGFSGADLENLLNEAALLAARRDYEKIEMPQCEEAIERVIMGPERKSRVILDKEKKIIAYHETGHALIAVKTPGSDPVRKVTILPRGMALGVTWSMPEEDKHLHTRQELIARMMGLLGGRAAESIVFGEITTGAANDLERCTELARNIVTKYGMSDKLGLVTYGKNQDHVFLGRDIVDRQNYSDHTAQEIDLEIKSLVDSCYNKAKAIISSNREKMDMIVEVLLQKEVLEGEELDELLGIVRADEDDEK